jgi:glycosyltransferase involved in cell wall biosynthesis
MRVLVLSEFYPHEKNPHEGIFVREQLAPLANHADLRVLAPAMRYLPLPRYKILRAQQPPVGYFSDDLCPVARFPVWNPPVIAEVVAPAMHRRGSRAALGRWQFTPDLIHAFWAYRSGYVAARLQEKYRCPLIITAEGSDIHTWLNEPRKRLKILHSLHRADALIAVSRALIEPMTNAGVAVTKMYHIPNGVDLQNFSYHPGALRTQLQNRLRSVSLFLCVANFFPVKGHDVLIRALALLPKEAGALILIGDGPEKSSIEKLVQELQLTSRVFFAGKKPHEEIAEWMSAADALVIPSRNEGWPTVIFEAMACGLQVVGSAVGGISEALNAADDLLAPPEDPAALAAAMLRAIQRQPDKIKLRQRAEAFSWERLSEQVLQVYRSVLGDKGR